MNRAMILATLAIVLAGAGICSKGTWIIDADSQLTIQGSTNVSNFTCRIDYCTGTDTLRYIEDNTTRELRFTRSRMTIPIRNFDCGAKPISKDFQKTLRAENHPNMEINFISLQNPNFKERTKVSGVVDITLAGSTSRFTVCYSVLPNPNGSIQLKGVHTVNFSDFRLAAPEKLKGLIKVNEGLKVEFDLVLNEI